MEALEVAASIVTIDRSGIFDADWYQRTYGRDDAIAGGSLVHYCVAGWMRGLRPCFLFDPEFYDADDVPAGTNPLLHYLRLGDGDGRRASVHFDAGWYRRAHAVPVGQNCLVHYLAHRSGLLHRPHPGFDPAWYMGRYTDVAESGAAGGLDPYEHYVCHGAGEGRAPSADALLLRDAGLFDTSHYRDRCPELLTEHTDPLLHFAGTDWRARNAANPVFDAGWYLGANEDVAGGGIDPLLHYATWGEAEARRPAAWFDPAAYRAAHALPDTAHTLGHLLARLPPAAATLDDLFDANFYLITYPDVREVGVDPLTHYRTDGEREGRWPNPYFDPAWYGATTGVDADLLLHYQGMGEAAGCRPVPYFDPDWYRTTYDPPGGRCLAHYLSVRRGQKHSPVGAFDVAAYVQRHRRAMGRNRDPFAHYLRVGIDADHDPGPTFDAAAYRRDRMTQEPGVSAKSPIEEKALREARNPLVHFLRRQAIDQR